MFAHRGGCAIGPENTLAAFDRGMATGVDGLELDVHLSADGIPVVIHDASLDRTTSGTGPVAARTADELARVDAAYWFGDGHRFPDRGQGIGVPTLREVLRRYADVRIIIEMKVDTAEMATAVTAVVREADAVERVCLAGFGRRCLIAARAHLPEAASSASAPEVRLALYQSWVGWPLGAVPFGGYQVPETAGRTRVVSPRFIRHAHRAGRKVQVWTVDDEPDMWRLLSWGVDALISNCPEVAVRTRDQYREKLRGR